MERQPNHWIIYVLDGHGWCRRYLPASRPSQARDRRQQPVPIRRRQPRRCRAPRDCQPVPPPHKPVLLPQSQGPTVGPKREDAGMHLVASFPRLLRREADGSDLRIGETHGGNHPAVEDAAVAGNHFGDHHALGHGAVGQHGLAREAPQRLGPGRQRACIPCRPAWHCGFRCRSVHPWESSLVNCESPVYPEKPSSFGRPRTAPSANIR